MKHKKLIAICVVALTALTLILLFIYNNNLRLSNEQLQNDDYFSFTVYNSIGINEVEGTICKVKRFPRSFNFLSVQCMP